jgi:hypothetical protein
MIKMPVPAAAPAKGDSGQPVLGMACAKVDYRRALAVYYVAATMTGFLQMPSVAVRVITSPSFAAESIQPATMTSR